MGDGKKHFIYKILIYPKGGRGKAIKLLNIYKKLVPGKTEFRYKRFGFPIFFKSDGWKENLESYIAEERGKELMPLAKIDREFLGQLRKMNYEYKILGPDEEGVPTLAIWIPKDEFERITSKYMVSKKAWLLGGLMGYFMAGHKSKREKKEYLSKALREVSQVVYGEDPELVERARSDLVKFLKLVKETRGLALASKSVLLDEEERKIRSAVRDLFEVPEDEAFRFLAITSYFLKHKLNKRNPERDRMAESFISRLERFGVMERLRAYGAEISKEELLRFVDRALETEESENVKREALESKLGRVLEEHRSLEKLVREGVEPRAIIKLGGYLDRVKRVKRRRP